MKEYLSSLFSKFFDTQVLVQDYELSVRPNYLVAGRNFYIIQLNELKFLVVQTADSESYNVTQYDRQREKIHETDGLEVVYYFKNVTAVQQESLINNHIPFISSNGNIFIPFIGLLFKGTSSAEKILSSEKMMPATQKIFLELIYSKEEDVKCVDLGIKLRLSKMSVTRACEQLKSMGLIEMEIRGRTGYLRTKYKGLELYEKAKGNLINPVQETLLIPEEELPLNALIAGETLLGKLTMLNPPAVKEYAIYKGDINKSELHPQEVRWSKMDGLVYLQLWKYEPELFLKKDDVDPVSLACSLSDVDDERVEGEVEDLLGSFVW